MELASQYPKEKKVKLKATIENVGFRDLILCYYKTRTHKKMFFLPGEIDNENICFIYTPVPGCTIMIESEPCVKITSISGINFLHCQDGPSIDVKKFKYSNMTCLN